MGWRLPWYSSVSSSFNYDFKVSFSDADIATGSVDYNFAASSFTPSEALGLSVFYRNEEGAVFRTYSCYARGLDMLNGACHHLDPVPRGRDKGSFAFPMGWLNFQDDYPQGSEDGSAARE